MDLSITDKSEKKMSIAKRKKLAMHDFEQQIKEIRAQFAEQLRCLEQRTDTQVAIIGELQEFYRRRAEVETEHGRSLEKLAKSLCQKHKNEKIRRESWHLLSTCTLWQQLAEDTKNEAKQRVIVSDLYSNHIVTKLTQRIDDVHRISKKCRDIGALAHCEISRVLDELHTAMKTYQLVYAQTASVETKFRSAEQTKLKYEEANPKKIGASRKYKALDKECEKKLGKYRQFGLKALRSRNEYLLCVDAANAALHKYFTEDLSDLIDCMDLGVQHWIGDLVATVVSARKALSHVEMDALAELSSFKDSLDVVADKHKFIETNSSAFMLPRRFEFRPHIADQTRHLITRKEVQVELSQRFTQIQKRLSDLRFESEEVWKTMETAEKRVLELQIEPKIAVETLFSSNYVENTDKKTCKELDVQIHKRRLDLAETEDFYINKFHHYLLNSNLIRRLQARHDCIFSALGLCNPVVNGCTEGNRPIGIVVTAVQGGRHASDGSSTEDTPCTPCGSSSTSSDVTRPVHCRNGRRFGAVAGDSRRPRLFGGGLEPYVLATGESIPLVVCSCIRMLARFGLHHQGVFRVSGSQVEINNFKDAFERGNDPLAVCADAGDVNSVAGVFKLYFRELREPLFPLCMFDRFTDCAKWPLRCDFLAQVCPLIASLPLSSRLVLRYLFAFLNHLSEYSDENMMDPYNLAICFGPTLLPIPDDKDQVFYHNFVSELVKNLIVYYEDVFSWDWEGPVYEKYQTGDDDDGEGPLNADDEPSAYTLTESMLESLPAVDEDTIDQSDGESGKLSRVHSRRQSIMESSIRSEMPSSVSEVSQHARCKQDLSGSPPWNFRPADVWTRRSMSDSPPTIDTTYGRIWSSRDEAKSRSSSRFSDTHRLSLQNGGDKSAHLKTTRKNSSSEPSAPLSPSSLREIKSELKAVLSSLEQFAVSDDSSKFDGEEAFVKPPKSKLTNVDEKRNF